ncbi:unnamed protein product [Caenorhabditis angaria]|uniref:Uncharacterized protein n=1 Tax=Caenorhabditis angaria TaxID=860376 RepID=A0A9P1IZ40_9PELO|nr:unnamed protein product [Caenorhabditis angaria]
MTYAEKINFFKMAVEEIEPILKVDKRKGKFFRSSVVLMDIMNILQCLDLSGIFINHIQIVNDKYDEIVDLFADIGYELVPVPSPPP